MKITTSIILSALVILATSCATPPPPPPALYQANSTAFVIDSLDGATYQVIQPTPSDKHENDALLAEAQKNFSHQAAVVILENYTESQPGAQFRDRSTPLFIALRQAGFQHIIFLQGNGVANPAGLITIANYD